MSGKEARGLRHGGVRSINNERQEEHGVREVFGVEGYDEK
jgi:hypothetical protein